MRVREAKAKKRIDVKNVRGREYVYEYYILPLNIYVPKHVVEKYGTDYVVKIDETTGVIVIKPKKLAEKQA